MFYWWFSSGKSVFASLQKITLWCQTNYRYPFEDSGVNQLCSQKYRSNVFGRVENSRAGKDVLGLKKGIEFEHCIFFDSRTHSLFKAFVKTEVKAICWGEAQYFDNSDWTRGE